MVKFCILVRWIIGSILGLALSFIGFNWLYPAQCPILYSPSIQALTGEFLSVHPNQAGFYCLKGAADLPPNFIPLLIQLEDKRFYSHFGIDPIAGMRSIGQFLRHGRVISGASTITMQLARLINPGPRTLIKKIKEMIFALQLEWRYSKKEILKFYLTLAPYGGNRQGIVAGSVYYFGKLPKNLTLPEQFTLLVLPQSPNRYCPYKHKEASYKRVNQLSVRFLKQGIVNAKDAVTLQKMSHPLSPTPFPKWCPHLAMNSRFSGQILTLNNSIQKQLVGLLKRYSTSLPVGQNCAAIIINNTTHHVVGYVGNAEYSDTSRRTGFVDMITKLRSPASTLKPFIYAMAMDRNLIQQDTLIDDLPLTIQGYKPLNYSTHFGGRVSIRDALIHSLNIPVVLILNQIGPYAFKSHLDCLGIRCVLPKNRAPELPIALGGVGISIWDIGTLYHGLANLGAFSPICLYPNSPLAHASQSLMCESSARKIIDILSQTPLPSEFPTHTETSQLSIAFKTGTSYGFRDSWCAGISPEYTVCVWVGRPDGMPCPGQTGRTHAAPTMLKIFEFLNTMHPIRTWPTIYTEKPSNTVSVFTNTLHNPDVPPLEILSPKNRSKLWYQTHMVLDVHLHGGIPPYFIFLNGYFFKKSNTNHIYITNLSPGFHTIDVQDSAHTTCRTTIQTVSTL